MKLHIPPNRYVLVANFQIGFALLLGLASLFSVFSASAVKLDEVALGRETTVRFAKIDGEAIHCTTIVKADACVSGIERRALPKTALWFGNSQLHAINQYRADDENGVAIAARQLRDADIDLVGFSQPNATLIEHFLLYEHLRREMSIDILVLPVMFDDTRAQSVRPEMRAGLQDVSTSELISRTDLSDFLAESSGEVGEDSTGSLQEKSEEQINTALTALVGWEKVRSQARAGVSIGLYQLRNWIFRIEPSSIRRKLDGPYSLNISALGFLLDRATADNVTVLLYIPPLRNDVPIPYDMSEYEAFKSEVQELAAQHDAQILNLENLVANDLWGLKDATVAGGEAEIDFMHFQGPGHVLLGTRIANKVRDLSP